MSTNFKILLLCAFALVGYTHANAKQHPFLLIKSETKVMTKASLDSAEATTTSMISATGNALIFSDSSAHVVVRTGPEDDMLSFRIQSIRNPTLIVREGTTLHVLFVNTDGDMQHDIRFSAAKPPFQERPDTSLSVGAGAQPHEINKIFSAEEITIVASNLGEYSYFCSVRGHAAGGMWGKVVIVSRAMSMNQMMRLGIDTSHPSISTNTSIGNMAASMPGMAMGDQKQMADGTTMGGMRGLLLTEPMSQEGSGTSWLPASSPMYMLMTTFDRWMLMFHGDIMPRYDHQGGPRGGNKFDAPNMFMLMAERNVSTDGEFTAHLMMSFDPLTEGLKGYPLLLQTGEKYQNVKLVDIQHPHDLIDEISVAYSQRFSARSAAFLYVGYPGEPALGPTVFMHRPSGMSNPNAPLSHHWMDATHVTFGVATAGFVAGDWKIEGSYFNGSEPDANRYDFDKIQFNSYSGRLSFNPTNDLSLQVSSGMLKNPEGDGVDVIRSTASAIYSKQYESGDWWSTTASWGENHDINLQKLEAFLLESQYTLENWSIYGRTEFVQKTNSELSINNTPDRINNVTYLTLGLTRKLFELSSFDFELGAQGSYYFVPSGLVSLYTSHPISAEMYLTIHPSL